MRAIAALFAVVLASPIPSLAADERGWQGWAFEVRKEGSLGWAGTWTPGDCELLRHQAKEDQIEGVGVCLPVTLTDEPAGIGVWAILVDDSGFVAGSSPEDFCKQDDPESPPIRPVESPACQRVWLRFPV